MPAPEVRPRNGRPVDGAALGRIRERLDRAAAAPWLHGEAARRMAQRLPLIKRAPRTVLDWCSHRGGGAAVLKEACPQAQIVRVESNPLLLGQRAAPWWSPRRHRSLPAATAADAIPAFGADLLWSNMGLHWETDPQAQFAQWRRLIAVDGFLMFTTLGPGTLTQLSELFARQHWGVPLAPLVDMHDLGDMLVHAGFADPVMDQELLTLTWPDGAAALAELRTLGGNAALGRFGGLRGAGWRRRLIEALQSSLDGDGRVRLTVELVYGHAFCTAPKVRLAEESRVGLEEMRAMMRGGKPSGTGGPLS